MGLSPQATTFTPQAAPFCKPACLRVNTSTAAPSDLMQVQVTHVSRYNGQSSCVLLCWAV
jgi:hypothetical protein